MIIYAARRNNIGGDIRRSTSKVSIHDPDVIISLHLNFKKRKLIQPTTASQKHLQQNLIFFL